MPSGNVVAILIAAGGLSLLVGTALSVCMTIELNKMLPPGKRLFPSGRDYHEIQRLHGALCDPDRPLFR